MTPPNRTSARPDGASPRSRPRDLILGVIAFVVFAGLGRAVGGWLDLRPAPPVKIEVNASPAPRRSPTPVPSPTPAGERIALVFSAPVGDSAS
jgi:hypothetical protein